MTQEEVLIYFIRKGCVVTPDDMISGVYGNKEGSFADKIAFIFHCTDMILFETANGEISRNIASLTREDLDLYYNQYLTIEKQETIKERLKEIEGDFIC